jgi:hypothetical protein
LRGISVPGGSGLLLMLALIGGLSIAGLVVIRRAGRWVRAWAGHEGRSPAFTLHELRELRSTGQISQAEFEALRGAAVAEVSSARAADASDTGGAHGCKT